MGPGAPKIRRGCNVLQITIQVIPLRVPKKGSHPLRIKIVMACLRLSGTSFEMNPRQSAIAHCFALDRDAKNPEIVKRRKITREFCWKNWEIW